MINDALLEILCCPLDRSPLTLAEPALVESINQAIAAQQVTNRAGQAVEKKFDSGLVQVAGEVLYPIIDGIPVLLPDEAILLSQFDEGHNFTKEIGKHG